MDQPSRTHQRVRRINDDLAADARRDGRTDVNLPFVCECDREGCFHPVWSRPDEFAAIRDAGGRLLAAGHGAVASTVPAAA